MFGWFGLVSGLLRPFLVFRFWQERGDIKGYLDAGAEAGVGMAEEAVAR